MLRYHRTLTYWEEERLHKSCERTELPDIIHSQYKLLDGLESAQHDTELHCKYTVFVVFDLLGPSSTPHIAKTSYSIPPGGHSAGSFHLRTHRSYSGLFPLSLTTARATYAAHACRSEGLQHNKDTSQHRVNHAVMFKTYLCKFRCSGLVLFF